MIGALLEHSNICFVKIDHTVQKDCLKQQWNFSEMVEINGQFDTYRTENGK
jgi:hypothetical protein